MSLQRVSQRGRQTVKKALDIGRDGFSSFAVAVVAVGLLVSLSGCMPEQSVSRSTPLVSAAPSTPDPAATSDQTVPDGDPAVLVSVIDGDTVETSAGTVRLIGIDTPERGQCGYDESSAAFDALVTPDDIVYLELPEGQNDLDAYGRLLRYVTTGQGVDIGLVQLQQGHAVARYDSRDGYPAHPREESYAAAQTATLGADGVVLTVDCAAAALTPPTASEPLPLAEPSSGDGWWRQYSSCTKLKKNTVGHPKGPFSMHDPAQVEIYNWFAYDTGNNGDGDNDGLACE